VAGEEVDRQDLLGRVVDRRDEEPGVADDEANAGCRVLLVVAGNANSRGAVAVVDVDGRTGEDGLERLAVGWVQVADLAVLVAERRLRESVGVREGRRDRVPSTVRTTSNGQRAPAANVVLMWTSSMVRVGVAASAADAARLPIARATRPLTARRRSGSSIRFSQCN
jgi:hypothetical protein